MSNSHLPRHERDLNGHPTVADRRVKPSTVDEDMEPKGYPTSDRYRSETVHAAETDDHGTGGKKRRGN